jgi:hypothetical protein
VPISEEKLVKVIKGGSYGGMGYHQRTSARFYSGSVENLGYVGFRVIKIKE